MKLVLYVVGYCAYVNVRRACSIGRIHYFVPADFLILPWGDIGEPPNISDDNYWWVASIPAPYNHRWQGKPPAPCFC